MFATLLAVFGLAAPARAASSYRVIDLGVLPRGGYSEALAVSNRGEVVGESSVPGGYVHAFSYTRSGGMVDLGTLGGLLSYANGVNNSGEVVGESFVANPFSGPRAFSYTPSGGMVDLGTLPSTNPNRLSIATGVNNRGQIVGYSSAGRRGNLRAFSYTPSGGMVDLGTLGGPEESYALAVSNRGQVVGQSNDRAFSYTPAGGMVDLPQPPRWGLVYADGVNDRGEIVGYGGPVIDHGQAFVSHAFYYTPSRGVVRLGKLGGKQSAANGVNDRGQIVGWSDTATSRRAFAYTRSGGMVKLPTFADGETSSATAVNDKGQIAGWIYRGPNLVQHAVLWQPIPPSKSP